ncbi:MAG: (2Fe-2S)-binding protein [Candidatus Asgardarchaeia archaeon]|nr:(2Fe-2S)-binding protein [Candidatus Odinarchaeota archaeon]
MIVFKLNGKVVELDLDPEMNLLKVLRNELGITSVKRGCDIGVCGVCTILVNGKPMKSCLMKLKDVEGKEVTTVEGIGTPYNLHPIQKAFIDHGAIQCGFCTPAMILVAYALLKQNPNPTREEIKKAINSVLCRCTGYIPIINAIEAVAKGKYGPI